MSHHILKVAFAGFLIAGSIAVPISVHWHLRQKSHAMGTTLDQQAVELARLTADNALLSNTLALKAAGSLSSDQLQELLRLRGEVARLREQTNALGRLTAENQRLEVGLSAPAPTRAPMTPGEVNAALAAETPAAMKNIIAALPAAMQAYALDHNGRTPKDFYELRKYFPKTDGRRMTGLYTFQFVRNEGPQPGDALILRESGSHAEPRGQVRVYSFTDGTVVEVVSTENDFETWEREHMKSPPPAH